MKGKLKKGKCVSAATATGTSCESVTSKKKCKGECVWKGKKKKGKCTSAVVAVSPCPSLSKGECKNAPKTDVCVWRLGKCYDAKQLAGDVCGKLTSNQCRKSDVCGWNKNVQMCLSNEV